MPLAVISSHTECGAVTAIEVCTATLKSKTEFYPTSPIDPIVSLPWGESRVWCQRYSDIYIVNVVIGIVRIIVLHLNVEYYCTLHV